MKEREGYRNNLLHKVDNRVNQYLSQDNEDNYNKSNDENNEKFDSHDDDIEALIFSSDEHLNPSDTESFLTSFGRLNGLKTITTLANNVTFHAATKDNLKFHDDPFTYVTIKPAPGVRNRYNRDIFYGILIDTGASLRSTAGYEQYIAYKNLQGYYDQKITLDETKAGIVNVKLV